MILYYIILFILYILLSIHQVEAGWFEDSDGAFGPQIPAEFICGNTTLDLVQPWLDNIYLIIYYLIIIIILIQYIILFFRSNNNSTTII